ncbi:MAG: AIR synthase-related protein [Candidatus Marinimicrobia bacterium]|nr:AIR synthase-related protein [Candidatus Neomarinimicrobiota bacterium]
MSVKYPPFSSFDLSVLKSIFDRLPTEKELNFIGSAIEPLISRRHFIDFTPKVSFTSALHGSTINNVHGLKCSYSDMSEDSIFNILLAQKAAQKKISCITVNHQDKAIFSTVHEQLKKCKVIDFSSESVLINNHQISDDFKNTDFIFSIGTGGKNDSTSKTIPVDSSVYLIRQKAKSTLKQFNYLNNLIHEINLKPKRFLLFLLNGYSPIFILLSAIMDRDGGVNLQFNRNSDIDDLLFQPADHGIMIFGNKGIYQKLKSFDQNSFQVMKLGRINDQNSFEVFVRNTQKLHIPKESFSFLWRSDNTVISSKEKKVHNIIESKPSKQSAWNKSLIKILKQIYQDKILTKGSLVGKDEEKIGEKFIKWKDEHLNGLLVMSFSEYNYLSKIDPESAGKIAISNAVRSIWCSGGIPIGIMIQNTFSTDSESLEESVSLNQSQETAVKHFKLDVLHKNISLDSKTIAQDISIIGKIPDKGAVLSSGFQMPDHFISILGSHRGELTGSVFQKCFPKGVEDQPVTIDLYMESKLGEVIQLGFESNLIQTATNVGRGGLSAAIVTNLIDVPDDIGARIHLSRKLLPEELLFGETQGLVLISLKEEDIMEFERICMNIGVPCTTVGRVTNTGRFSFNDMIDISTKKLKTIYE